MFFSASATERQETLAETKRSRERDRTANQPEENSLSGTSTARENDVTGCNRRANLAETSFYVYLRRPMNMENGTKYGLDKRRRA